MIKSVVSKSIQGSVGLFIFLYLPVVITSCSRQPKDIEGDGNPLSSFLWIRKIKGHDYVLSDHGLVHAESCVCKYREITFSVMGYPEKEGFVSAISGLLTAELRNDTLFIERKH